MIGFVESIAWFGSEHAQITLSYPDEYLKQVVGTNEQFLNSIAFVTNKTTYGPFGNSEGQKFESRADGVVVGFFGRSGSIIDQLGVLTIEGSADNVLQVVYQLNNLTYLLLLPRVNSFGSLTNLSIDLDRHEFLAVPNETCMALFDLWKCIRSNL